MSPPKEHPKNRARAIPPGLLEDTELVATILALVDKRPGPGCWPWRGRRMSCKGRRTYGVFKIRGVRFLAHRLVQAILAGPLPDSVQVNHKCNNELCVRPDPAHTYRGTQRQNMTDRAEAGHAAIALSEAAVLEIRRRVATGERQAALARAFHVSQIAISAIARGVTWKHVDGPRTHRPKPLNQLELLRLIAQGLTRRQMAARLGVRLGVVIARLDNRPRPVRRGSRRPDPPAGALTSIAPSARPLDLTDAELLKLLRRVRGLRPPEAA